MTEESIIDKIRKLLRLSEGTDNEAEAAAAAGMAQRLMSQHSIEAAKLTIECGDKQEDIVNPQSHFGKYASWKAVALGAIAKANGCGFYKSDRNEFATHHSMHLFGRPSDIEMCRELIDWVVLEIDHLARVRCPGEGRTFAHNYRYGCAEAVARSVREEAEAAVAGALAIEGGSALVVLKDALAVRSNAVARYGREKLRLRSSGRSSFNPDAAARAAGRADGAGIYQGKSPKRKIQ